MFTRISLAARVKDSRLFTIHVDSFDWKLPGGVFVVRPAWWRKDPCQPDWRCHEGSGPGWHPLKDFSYICDQNPTESEVKKLVVEHRADDRVTFEVFLPIMQVSSHWLLQLPRNIVVLMPLVHIKLIHILWLFDASRLYFHNYFKAICSRRSTDTSDDFIEGLRHFDKVLVLQTIKIIWSNGTTIWKK